MPEILDFKHETAEGPEGLRGVLDRLFNLAKQDQAFAEEEHAIVYRHGDNESLLIVKMDADSAKFWFNDKLGRSAKSAGVDKIINTFSQEKFGTSNPIYQVRDLNKHDIVDATQNFRILDFPAEFTLNDRYKQLKAAIAKNEWQTVVSLGLNPSTMFGGKPQTPIKETTPTPENKPKPGGNS